MPCVQIEILNELDFKLGGGGGGRGRPLKKLE